MHQIIRFIDDCILSIATPLALKGVARFVDSYGVWCRSGKSVSLAESVHSCIVACSIIILKILS